MPPETTDPALPLESSGAIHPFCPQCGYDLCAIPSDRCPECGLAIDRTQLHTARTPWLHRAKIGRWRALWRTVWIVIVRPSAIASDCAHPVNFADALAFRRALVVLAMIPTVIMTTSLYAASLWWPISPMGIGAMAMGAPARPQPTTYLTWGWFFDALTLPVVWLGAALFVTFATGVASYFYHPRELPIVRQNRAIALSYYAAAPLGLIPWAIFAAALCRSLVWFEPTQWVQYSLAYTALTFGMLGCAGLLIVLWIRATLVLLRRTTHCSAVRLLAAGTVLPTIWFTLCALLVIALPCAYIFVQLIVHSLIG